MTLQNLRIIGIEKEEEIQIKGTENVFNKITEENFSSLNKDVYQGTRGT